MGKNRKVPLTILIRPLHFPLPRCGKPSGPHRWRVGAKVNAASRYRTSATGRIRREMGPVGTGPEGMEITLRPSKIRPPMSNCAAI